MVLLLSSVLGEATTRHNPRFRDGVAVPGSERGGMTYGIIGLGTMGSAIAGTLRASANATVIATTHRAATAEAAAKRLGIGVGTDSASLARASDVIVLSVKPHQARAVLESIAPDLAGKLLISVCAAMTTADLESWSGNRTAVIRAMPNTPCLIGRGMTVLAAGKSAQPKDLDEAVAVFAPLGQTAVLDESLMDAATGLSGCGPAYAFLIIEALADAGVQLGIPRATSTLLAAQTLLGASQLVLETKTHPAVLKDQVTTPGGCTIDGLVALEDGGLRSVLIGGVVAAANRSIALRRDVR
jgi:pyrroline-5-carboxylate reductase